MNPLVVTQEELRGIYQAMLPEIPYLQEQKLYYISLRFCRYSTSGPDFAWSVCCECKDTWVWKVLLNSQNHTDFPKNPALEKQLRRVVDRIVKELSQYPDPQPLYIHIFDIPWPNYHELAEALGEQHGKYPVS